MIEMSAFTHYAQIQKARRSYLQHYDIEESSFEQAVIIWRDYEMDLDGMANNVWGGARGNNESDNDLGEGEGGE